MKVLQRAVDLVLLAGLVACSSLAALGNPIPITTLLMPEEYIDALIFVEQGRLWAVVEGSYLFENTGVSGATMYYPVPENTTEIGVWLDGRELGWRYATYGREISPRYPTAAGNYRMIVWEALELPRRFQIKVHYRHELPQLGGRYAFLYALGTGRFLADPEETTAYVKVRLELDLSDLEAFVGPSPLGCQLDRAAGETVLSLTVKSEPFRPLVEDLLIMFRHVLSIPEAIDGDGDGRISDGEMRQAVRYWIDDAEVPGTDGQRISDLTLHKLAEFWVLGERFVIAPYQARDRAIEYLLEKEPSSGLPRGAIWDAARATPEGLLGYETIRYTHKGWQVEVGYPVIPYPDYAVSLGNSASGSSWRVTVRAAGLIAD